MRISIMEAELWFRRTMNMLSGLPVVLNGRKQQSFPKQGDGMKVIGLAGWSGAGKTTLLTRLVPHLVAQGMRVSTIKHAHHNFDVDVPGKDSWAHRQAGASEVLISSGRRWALMHELRDAAEPSLPELLRKMSPADLVIVEGFKAAPHRKIEVHRMANGKNFLYPKDPGIYGIVTDAAVDTELPVAHLDDIPAIAALIEKAALPIEAMLAEAVLVEAVPAHPGAALLKNNPEETES